jgi:hypothetical protein
MQDDLLPLTNLPMHINYIVEVNVISERASKCVEPWIGDHISEGKTISDHIPQYHMNHLQERNFLQSSSS